ncbi:DUF2190 family protein [Roseibacterium beibuensis]|uniref:DUF2190 family protein n=1 Tax=[Roseibacterium] beibuensis TaxID=1193142 RepID=A0ABP9LE44_9RHOB|nr:DUF2190 family protein [Roseibacterium beibuensis]MCS6624345.1 DUF2190 family protein [Roseibacterium beibuensis]
MKTFIQPGAAMTVPAPAAKTSGDGVLVGSLFGIAQHTAESGADLTIQTVGVFTITKATGSAWTVGAKIYWDDSNSRCTTAESGNTLVGVAAAAAGSADTVGAVRLGIVA